MKPIRYEDYESITDTIFYASNLQLQFSVKLYNKDMNGNRRSIYGETLYNTSSKYKDNYEVRKINRKIYCNLVLGNIRDTDFYKKDNVFITYQDMILLRQTLNSVANNVIKNIGVNSKGSLELKQTSNPDIIMLHGKRLEFIPIVLNYENEQMRGVRVTLNNYDNYNDISFDQFLGLKYIIDSFDMYGNAVSLLNYLGRPEFGTNTFNLNNNGSYSGMTNTSAF